MNTEELEIVGWKVVDYSRHIAQNKNENYNLKVVLRNEKYDGDKDLFKKKFNELVEILGKSYPIKQVGENWFMQLYKSSDPKLSMRLELENPYPYLKFEVYSRDETKIFGSGIQIIDAFKSISQ